MCALSVNHIHVPTARYYAIKISGNDRREVYSLGKG